jgi:pyocin large subunit-like protein
MSGTISATTATLIAAGVGAAATGIAIAEMPKSPTAPTQQATSTEQATASQDAAQAQATALAKRRGMASTILTSPLGSSTSQTQKATLGA